jgi:hypothetical protein
MSISLEGLQSGGLGEERSIALLKVEHNNQTYDWKLYIPKDADLSAYLSLKEASIYADIEAKEAAWEALDPKTRTITDPMTGEPVDYPIDKSEVVAPDFPDYYAKRRDEYPSLADQLDAYWKGGTSTSAMKQKIAAVKSKYPKP